jgi:ferric-dicitrate binding protein FerR (iron transport regulator)
MLQDRTWLLIGRKMANEASPQELKELEEILKNNPELHFSFQALTEIWQQSPTENLSELESAYQAHLNRLKSQLADHPGSNEDLAHEAFFTASKRSFFRRNSLMFAAVLLAVILTIGGVLYTIPSGMEENKTAAPPVESEVYTRHGSKTNIVLPDGTKVSLNAGSKLTYDKTFNESVRNVKLIGEAYFDVVHNAEKPFVIHTTAMDIKVLGTEFNVKSYPDEKTTETSLIRGSIEVTVRNKRAAKFILKPNDKLVVSNNLDEIPEPVTKPGKTPHPADKLITLEQIKYFSLDSTIVETSWVQNRLIFEDESFDQVATRMSRWYGVEFTFEDDAIRNERFTGNFRNETVDDALKALQLGSRSDFGFNFKMSADKHITITKK